MYRKNMPPKEIPIPKVPLPVRLKNSCKNIFYYPDGYIRHGRLIFITFASFFIFLFFMIRQTDKEMAERRARPLPSCGEYANSTFNQIPGMGMVPN